MKPERMLLAGLVALYCAAYGSLLVASDFLPYVFDNNESFSAWFHALNLYEYGLEKTWGVTDESFAFHPAAHPYAYTHGGNFPRLPALLLYWLGAKTVEMQIAVSTFTVGLATLVLAFGFFRRLSGPIFATVLCVLLFSDYLMFVQWHVNTYRVWAGFLLFAALLCASGSAGARRGTCLALNVPIFAAIFYSEITFAVFCGILCAFWALYEIGLKPRPLVVTWMSQLTGALIAVAVLVWQNVKFLGREGFMTDLYLTFVARNSAETHEVMFEQVRSFAETHKLAFWYNFYDGSSLRTPWEFIKNFSHYELQVYTPVLVMLVLIVVLALAARPDPNPTSRRATPESALEANGLTLLFVVFAAVVGLDGKYLGALDTEFPLSYGLTTLGLVSFAGASAVLALWLRTSLLLQPRAGESGMRRIAAPLLLVVLIVGVLGQRNFFSSSHLALRAAVAQPWMSAFPLKFVIVGAVAYAILVVTGRHGESETETRLRALAPAGAFFGLASLSFFIVFMLSPGYVMTGYLTRHTALTVFFHLAPVALAILACGLWTRAELARLGGSLRPMRPVSLVPLALVAATLLVIPAYWIVLQLRYAQIFPADHYGFLTRLKQPAFRGAGIVTNNYAAPAAASTGGWAFLDTEISRAEVWLGEDGYEVSRDLKYLWLADREQNPEYLKPDYFVCMLHAGMWAGVQRVASRFPSSRCSDMNIVETALDTEPRLLAHQLVERDESGRDRWAIVKLDWDYPPYLAKLDASGERVRACAQRSNDRVNVRASHAFEQQEGKIEGASQIRVYQLGDPNDGERLIAQTDLGQTGGRAELVLDSAFSGRIQVGVRPATASKTGEEFRSASFEVGTARGVYGSCDADSTP